MGLGELKSGLSRLVSYRTEQTYTSQPMSYSGGEALVTMPADNYIFSGNSFSVEYTVDIASGNAEYDIAFDTTGMTRTLVALPTKWANTAGWVTISLGACTSYTGGTELSVINREYRFQSSYPTQTTVKYDVTPTGFSASDTLLLIGFSSTNQTSGGGSFSSDYPIVLEPGLKYIFRANNGSGENIKLFFGLSWYEIG